MTTWQKRAAALCTDEDYARLREALELPKLDQEKAAYQPCEIDTPFIPAQGRKDDQGKTDWSLLPYDALEPVVRVLMFGAERYGPENWRDVPNAERRYWSAAQRHLISHLNGETHDEESGLPHLAHAACCVLFMLAIEWEEE